MPLRTENWQLKEAIEADTFVQERAPGTSIKLQNSHFTILPWVGFRRSQWRFAARWPMKSAARSLLATEWSVLCWAVGGPRFGFQAVGAVRLLGKTRGLRLGLQWHALGAMWRVFGPGLAAKPKSRSDSLLMDVSSLLASTHFWWTCLRGRELLISSSIAPLAGHGLLLRRKWHWEELRRALNETGCSVWGLFWGKWSERHGWML